LSTMREGRREWECDLRDDSSRWELTHVTKHCPRISPYSNLQHWKEFKLVVRTAKRTFFDNKIHEIASSNKRP